MSRTHSYEELIKATQIAKNILGFAGGFMSHPELTPMEATVKAASSEHNIFYGNVFISRRRAK